MTSSGGSINGPRLNLGIIGLGGGASQMLPAFVRHSRVSVTAAADIDQEQLDKFRTQYEGETFFSSEAICQSRNVDVVYIATPNQFHTEHAWAKDQPQSTFVSSAEDKAHFLGNVNLFKHLSSEVLQKLTPRVHLVALPAGHVIKENELTDGLYIIKSRITQVTKPTGSRDLAVDLATLAQGESFGEIGLVDGLPP